MMISVILVTLLVLSAWVTWEVLGLLAKLQEVRRANANLQSRLRDWEERWSEERNTLSTPAQGYSMQEFRSAFVKGSNP